jgi:hypothetical protein
MVHKRHCSLIGARYTGWAFLMFIAQHSGRRVHYTVVVMHVVYFPHKSQKNYDLIPIFFIFRENIGLFLLKHAFYWLLVGNLFISVPSSIGTNSRIASRCNAVTSALISTFCSYRSRQSSGDRFFK